MKLHYSLGTGYVQRNPGVPLEIDDEDLEGMDEDERNAEIDRRVADDARLDWEEDSDKYERVVKAAKEGDHDA